MIRREEILGSTIEARAKQVANRHRFLQEYGVDSNYERQIKFTRRNYKLVKGLRHFMPRDIALWLEDYLWRKQPYPHDAEVELFRYEPGKPYIEMPIIETLEILPNPTFDEFSSIQIETIKLTCYVAGRYKVAIGRSQYRDCIYFSALP